MAAYRSQSWIRICSFWRCKAYSITTFSQQINTSVIRSFSSRTALYGVRSQPCLASSVVPISSECPVPPTAFSTCTCIKPHRHHYSTGNTKKDGTEKKSDDDDDYIYDDSDDEFVDQFEVLPGEHPNTPVPGRELFHPEKGDLVYYGTLEKYVKGLKIFSFTTSGIILGVQPLMWSSMASSSLIGKSFFFGTVFFFSLGTPVLLHMLSRKYVIDMYYNAKTDVFTATSYTFLGKIKVHTFKSDDVYVPDLPQAFVFMIVNKTTKLYLDPLLLRSRYAYIKLKKYDQPMSLDFVEERMKKRILDKEEESKGNK